MTGTVTATGRLAVVAYNAPGLGDRSYLLHDGNKALVVDPQRDPHPYLATATDLGVDITLVLETHVHNDYVSGGLALARRAGATYRVPGGVAFEFSSEGSALEEGDLLHVGELNVRVLSTPGHTPQHLAFLAWDAQGTKAVLTGGSLLSGATGRTDLFRRRSGHKPGRSPMGIRTTPPSGARPQHGGPAHARFRELLQRQARCRGDERPAHGRVRTPTQPGGPAGPGRFRRRTPP